MARYSTGVSKKANREMEKAFELVLEWRKTRLVDNFSMTPEVAWSLSGGKFGTEPVMISAMPLEYQPEGEPTIDAMKVALYVIKMGGAA